MRKIGNILMIVCAMLITLSSCTERTTYEINGTVEGFEDGSKVVLVTGLRKPISETVVKDGKFQFTGSVEQAMFANISFEDYRNFRFILENDDYKLIRSKEEEYIKGGKINSIVYGYKWEDAFRKMEKEHNEAPNPMDGIDQMDKEAVTKGRKIIMARASKESAYVRAYLNSLIKGENSTLVKMFATVEISDWDNYGFDRKVELFNEYEKEIGAHPELVQCREGIVRAIKRKELQESIKPGKPFKEVVGETPDGKQLKLSEVVAKNKYTLLEMWSSGCKPCRAEFPHLKKAYAHYHKKGFEIYALSLDRKEKNWKKALKQEDVPWINVVDYQGTDGDGAKDYGVVAIPASFLIDQKGTIVASMKQVRGFGLDEKLEELLGE